MRFLVVLLLLFTFSYSFSIDLSGCYKRVFKVSVYYSPLPNQKFYYRGNYRKEIKLNGRGVRGASGKLVFNGMLAAGKKYPFGTKIYFPELGGVGQVEDRGQAIVHAGERGQKYDRIDIWGGKGDVALMRALSFGKRVMVAYVCPANKKMKVGFNWNNFPILDNFFKKTLWGIGLYVGRNDEWVSTLQYYLKELGFFNYEVTGYFGNITKKAVEKFQSYYHIKTNGWWGYFGPHTRDKLKKVLKEKGLLKYDVKKKQVKQEPVLVASPNPLLEQAKKELTILKRGLGRGYHTYEVKVLQKYLKQLGYYNGPVDGYYSQKTVDAVARFQLNNGIISSTDSYAAGWFGPSTRKLFKKMVLEKLAN